MDTNKKVLVYLQEGSLTKTGGPIGYNYALRMQLQKMGVTNVHFLPGGEPFKPGIGKKLKNTWYGNILKSVKDFWRWTSSMHKNVTPPVDFNDYDIIHFHGCQAMFSVRKYLKDYKGKVLLTSHSPRISYQEIMSLLTPWGQKYLGWYYKKMVKFDEYAFNRADSIIFPCPEAEEPYYNTWKDYAAIKKNKRENYKYLLTGTYKCSAKYSREDIFQKYNIPNEAFVICYVGRHNDVKGYDKLKEIGEILLAQKKNIYFLIAGEEYPMKGLSDNRWIEVGWTNDPHSIIASSDVFILPNKETYFDLILLEVLSLGKIVIASNTGGNKYFEGKIGKGVSLYNSDLEAVSIISSLHEMDIKEREAIQANNILFFDKYLSLPVFANNYIKLINEL